MKKITQSLFALSTLTLAMQAGAAGFALNETSASAAGTAFAGRGSNAEDASIMASNPAGIALLDQAQVTGGMGVVVPKGKFEGTGTNVNLDGVGIPSGVDRASGSEDNFLKTAVIPFGYFAMPYDEKWSFGLGIYAPFGSKTDYDDDWAGRHLANKTDMSVINIQPTVAYKF
ncbi:MAG: OmpP1/FadL family transporter, partial [Endozoicomonas sp.]